MASRSLTNPADKPVNGGTESPSERLLSAATELFARHGYDSVSTGEIAAAAGLTQSMVHYHFGNKEQLWKAVIDRIMRLRGRTFPIMSLGLQDVDPLSRLKIIVRNFIISNASDPALTRILIHEGMRTSPRLTWLAHTYMLPGYEMWNKTIEEAMEANQIRRLPLRDVTNIIIGACTLTFSLDSLLEEMYGEEATSREAVESMSESLVTIIFEGLKVPPDQKST